MSYWTSDNIVKVGETSVSIPAEQGLTYTVGATSRRVSFEIPRSVKFLSGKDSYLEFDLEINHPAVVALIGKTRLQWDPAGAGMMCQNIRIYTADRMLLEEINEYNQLVAVRGDYDTDASRRGSRSLMEGGTVYNQQGSSTLGGSQGEYTDLHTNPWFKPLTGAGPLTGYDETTMGNVVHCCVPIHSGIFSGAIYPNMLTGLYMEIDLMPAPRVIRQLDSVLQNRRRNNNPVIHTLHLDDGTEVTTLAAGGGARTIDSIFFDFHNNMDALNNFPFVVGECVGFTNRTDPALAAGSAANIDGDGGGAYAPATISRIEMDNTAAVAGVDRVLVTFANSIDVLAAGGGRGGAVGVGAAENNIMFSVGVSEAASFPVTYTVKNLNLVAHQVDLDPSYEAGMLSKARSGGSIQWDINSWTNYKNSLLASERQGTFLIHANNARAKAALIIPTDASVYTDAQMVSSTGTYEVTRDAMDTLLNSARPGISGCCDFLSSIQFQLDGKLVPARPVSTKKIATRKSIDAFHIFELEKTLDNSGVTPHSFKKFMENFLVGRGFAVNNGVMDLRDKDFSVILNYSEGTAPTKPKMFSTFVHHLRRIEIKSGQARIVV
tara:strand:- start:2545 stop:4359 length:1815 start_codon:yes stop_codon:yes gene_type:complete